MVSRLSYKNVVVRCRGHHAAEGNIVNLTKRARRLESRRSIVWRDRPVFGVETFFGNKGQRLRAAGARVEP